MIKMKDLTGANMLWNVAPKNETQTAFRRFARVPHGEVRSMFSDSAEEFANTNPLRKTEIDTPFSHILGPLVLGGDDDD